MRNLRTRVSKPYENFGIKRSFTLIFAVDPLFIE